VSRFDGKSFVNFTTAEGLAGNSVKKILEDKSGNLWFATNGGVSKFVPSKDASTGTFIITAPTKAYLIMMSYLWQKTSQAHYGLPHGEVV
jgi:ligand-binding sensor domain-containing protein